MSNSDVFHVFRLDMLQGDSCARVTVLIYGKDILDSTMVVMYIEDAWMNSTRSYTRRGSNTTVSNNTIISTLWKSYLAI